MERKLLIHISDRDKWHATLNLVAALENSHGEKDVEVVIVADIFAGGVCVACSRTLREQMAAAAARGCRLLVCRDSLTSLNLRPEALPAFIESIPNSLLEISKLRAEGFEYIKI